MVKEVECDIFDSGADIVCHSCNCQVCFGAGIALEIKNRFPEVFMDDCETIRGDRGKLGTIRIVKLTTYHPTIKYCTNMYSQFSMGRDKRHVNYEALYRCLEAIRGHITNTAFKIAFPYKLSSQNAGGSWKVVKCMLEDVFMDSPREVLICKHLNLS